MLFCIPCYADDLEVESDISMNDVIIESDISANDNVIDNDVADLLSAPLLAIDNNSDVIDYSEQLNTILNSLEYFSHYGVEHFSRVITLPVSIVGESISFCSKNTIRSTSIKITTT